MGVPTLSRDCDRVTATDGRASCKNKSITKAIPLIANITVYPCGQIDVFPMYHCKTPDLKHMPFTALLFFLMRFTLIKVYTTAQQSILSLISHYSISWCVMCYRWYVYSHSTLCATGPLSACGHTHSASLHAVNTPKNSLCCGTHFLLVHTGGSTPRLWIMWSVLLIVYGSLTHECWVFSCVFMPRVKAAIISLPSGSTVSIFKTGFY